MKNIYNITKGQLISLWFFGVIGWFYAIDSYSDFSSFLSIFIPAFLVFYTIGWRTSHNLKVDKSNLGTTLENIKTFLPKRDLILKFVKPIIVIILFIIIILFFVNSNEERVKKEKLTEEYNNVIFKMGILEEKASSCMEPVREKKYQEELRDCNLLKNKVKHDYNFCVSLSSINSPASCLYDHDYEKIDCSEETLMKNGMVIVSMYRDMPASCKIAFDELNNAKKIVEEYSKMNK